MSKKQRATWDNPSEWEGNVKHNTLTYAVKGYEEEDATSEWILRHAGRTTKISGPLSAALFEAAKLTAQDKEVKISDAHGESVFFLRG